MKNFLLILISIQNSRTLGRSRSIRHVGFHSRTIALRIVALIGVWGCGGGTSQSVNDQSPPPTPTITTISPNSAVAGGAAFTLTINGTNFVASSMVKFGGSAPATTFVNSTQLTAAIPAASIASTGTPAVTVTNPAPGGGTSNAINFTVTSSASTVPTISFLSPSCVPAGEQFVDSVYNQLTVVGQNFVPGSVVRWNGSDRPTVFDENVVLTAQISASDIAAAGTAAVTVSNPEPGGGTSNTSTFTITTGAVDPQSITVDPAGKFAYVASSGNVWDIDFGSVLTYAINPATGALTSTGVIGGIGINGTPEFFNSVALDPSGKFAYAADGGAFPYGGSGSSSSVSMYSINSTTGDLTSIGIIDAGTSPDSVAVDPAGKFAYVTNFGSNDVSMYTIDATTGTLISIGTIATGTDPVSIAVDPAGKFAYVTNSNSNDVSMYTINATTGALTSVGTIAAGTNPVSVGVDP